LERIKSGRKLLEKHWRTGVAGNDIHPVERTRFYPNQHDMLMRVNEVSARRRSSITAVIAWDAIVELVAATMRQRKGVVIIANARPQAFRKSRYDWNCDRR
jgi:hypothetical protein